MRRLRRDSSRYSPGCRKGEGCPRAHSKAELESWKAELSRPYSRASHRLRLCNTVERNSPCKEGLECKYAHSQKELDSWKESRWDGLYSKIRDYQQDHHQMKCCNSLLTKQYCKRELDCKFAHSEEELESWMGRLDCRKSSKKLLEMCRNAAKGCKYGKECRYAHNEKELKTWRAERHHNYLQSDASIPERCTYTIPVPICQFGTSCPYAHTDEERMELIKSLNCYDTAEPRPIPRHGKLLAYTLCENSKNPKKSINGKCIYGQKCKQAHSTRELEVWEAERKAEQLIIIRPFCNQECKLCLCKDVDRARGRGRARGMANDATIEGRCSGKRCPYAHSEEELKEWIRNSELPMLGAPQLTSDGKERYSDPFLPNIVDYQRQFSDKLATVLTAIVKRAIKDDRLKGKLGAFIDYNRAKIDATSEEGQVSNSLQDIQYLLGYLQRNSAELANYFGMDRDYMIGVVGDFLEIRNALAHSLYKRAEDKEEREKTERFIQGGISFIQHVIEKLDAVKKGYEGEEDEEVVNNDEETGGQEGGAYQEKDDREVVEDYGFQDTLQELKDQERITSEVLEEEEGGNEKDLDENAEIHTGYAALLQFQSMFRSFLSYQTEWTRSSLTYPLKDHTQRRAAALETLQVIKELIEEEIEPGPITGFVAISLNARFRRNHHNS